MEIRKLNEFLAIYLLCEQEICEERSIECVLEFRLISASGKSYSDQCDSVVKMESSWGNHYFIRWNEMEKEYVQNDSICLEAHVLVINVTGGLIIYCSNYNKYRLFEDKPRDIAHAEKTFVLSDTVKNMSRIKEGWFYNTKIQNRFNIPWLVYCIFDAALLIYKTFFHEFPSFSKVKQVDIFPHHTLFHIIGDFKFKDEMDSLVCVFIV